MSTSDNDIEKGIPIDENAETDELPEDTIYLLFKGWYEQSINRHFLHAASDSYFSFLHKLSTYTVIILSAISAFIAAIILIFAELNIQEAIIASSIIILILNAIKFIVSSINSVRNFGELAQSHKRCSDDFGKLSEDIIKLFTPLSNTEAEIDLAQQRDYIQTVINFWISTSPSIPGKIIKNFNQTKNKSSKYQQKMKLFETIQSDVNVLFAPIQNNIINNRIQENEDILFGDGDELPTDIPELTKLYNEAQQFS